MSTLTGLTTTALYRVLDTTNDARLIADIKLELEVRSQRLAGLIGH